MIVDSNSIYDTSRYMASYNSTSATAQSTQFAELLMDSIDSDSSGSFDLAEFSSAALALSSSNDATSSSESFSVLDENQDGVVSVDELATSIESMMSEQGVMAAGGPPSGPPPGPPPSQSEEDDGYTQDELSTLANETSSTDANLSSLFETLASNFDEADANGDGKVTAAESMAYNEASQEAQASDTSTTEDTESNLMSKILQQIIAGYSSETSSSRLSSFNLSA